MDVMKKCVKRLALFGLMMAVAFSMILPTTTNAAAKKPTKITLKASKTTVTVGSKTKVKVKTVKPKSASKAVTFKSSNKKIATVTSKGVVTGKKQEKSKLQQFQRRTKR